MFLHILLVMLQNFLTLYIGNNSLTYKALHINQWKNRHCLPPFKEITSGPALLISIKMSSDTPLDRTDPLTKQPCDSFPSKSPWAAAWGGHGTWWGWWPRLLTRAKRRTRADSSLSLSLLDRSVLEIRIPGHGGVLCSVERGRCALLIPRAPNVGNYFLRFKM